MCLKILWFDILTALMAQTLEGFNDLCIKAHDMMIHLNKHKRDAKEACKIGKAMRQPSSPKEASPIS